MGWFWADKPNHGTVDSNVAASVAPHGINSSNDIGRCPVMAGNSKMNKENPLLNPLNNMPNLSHEKHRDQKINLPKERTVSTIPKGTSDEYWEYPSPQQMYNAMIRKGKIDPNTGEEIPEDAVESMVHVHNFLNEGCWQEILEWEKPYTEKSHIEPKLLKFTGRPDQLSPKARWNYWMGQLFPNHYQGELPFDRHDWVVLRRNPEGKKEVRYVLDFYGGPDDADGLPTFNIDVRPALDSYENCRDRFIKYTKPIWDEYVSKK
ncbi:Holocytochrome-c synthase [Nakaseomyces bracarensis]|uniref:Holocytochrome c-type synthase n=1 Tax=Nakaseomyces bracarensis TaxID=273131 RepID=A0ABR4NM23_9SACH